MRSPGTLVSLLVIGLTSALLFTACGGDDEDVPTPAAPKSATTRPDTPAPIKPAPPVTRDELPPPTSEVEAQFAEKVEVPDYYPKDAPVWPGVKPAEASRTANDRATIVWGIEDSGDNVRSFVRQSMAENGWELMLDQELEVGHMLQGKKGERLLNAVTTPLRDTGKTVLVIAVSL